MKVTILLAAFLIALGMVLSSGFFAIQPTSDGALYKINKISGQAWYFVGPEEWVVILKK